MNQTLGQYFTELRLATRAHPVLDRLSVEAMDCKQIQGEMRRRYYRPPVITPPRPYPRHPVWVKYFLAGQAKSSNVLSSREVAKRAGINATMIWRMEHERSVGVETVRAAFVKGLGLDANGPEVHRALALWTGTQTRVKVDADFKERIADVQQTATFSQFLARAVPVLAAIPASEYDAVLEALSNPATVESLAALNKLAATAGKPKLRVVPKGEKVSRQPIAQARSHIT